MFWFCIFVTIFKFRSKQDFYRFQLSDLERQKCLVSGKHSLFNAYLKSPIFSSRFTKASDFVAWLTRFQAPAFCLSVIITFWICYICWASTRERLSFSLLLAVSFQAAVITAMFAVRLLPSNLPDCIQAIKSYCSHMADTKHIYESFLGNVYSSVDNDVRTLEGVWLVETVRRRKASP